MGWNKDLNPFVEDVFRTRVSKHTLADNTTRYEVLQQGTLAPFLPDYLDDTEIYQGRALYVEKPGENDWFFSTIEPLCPLGVDAARFHRVRVRIPELHAHIPEPCGVGGDSPSRAQIEMHPLFVAASEGTEEPQPGDTVSVSFTQGPEGGIQAGGIYHGIFQAAAGVEDQSALDVCQALVGLFEGPQRPPPGGYTPSQPGASTSAPPATFPYRYQEKLRLAQNYDSADIPNKSQHAPVLNGLHPDFMNLVKIFIYNAWQEGVTIELGSGYRSSERQAELVRRYNAGEEGLARPAPAGGSHHQLGMAVDLNAILADGSRLVLASTPAQWEPVRTIGESAGLYWGGRFSTNYDPIHFDFRRHGPYSRAERVAFFQAAQAAGNAPNRHPLSTSAATEVS